MALPVKKIGYQAQLEDSIKEQYPNSAVVALTIQQLTNVPTLVADQFLKVNAAGTAIELSAGTGTTPVGAITAGAAFPASPTNNQVFILTHTVGTSRPSIWQYRVNVWVDLLVGISTNINWPVGIQLPTVVTNGIPFFLTQIHLTNTPGVYIGVSGAWIKIASIYNDTTITNRVTTNEGAITAIQNTIAGIQGVVTHTILYGTTAVQAVVSSDATQAQIDAEASFAIATNRNDKTDNLQTGILLPYTFPSPIGFYRPWIAVKNSDINNLRIYGGDPFNETTNWTNTGNEIVNNSVYSLYVRNLSIAQGTVLEWFIKNYS